MSDVSATGVPAPKMTVSQALAVIAEAGLAQVQSKEKYRKWGGDDAIFLAAELYASKALGITDPIDGDMTEFDKWANWAILAAATFHEKVKNFPQD